MSNPEFDIENFRPDEQQPQQPNPQKKVPIIPPRPTLGNIKRFEGDIKATNWRFARKMFENEKYTFKTLDIEVSDNEVAYTVSQYIIRPNEKIPWIAFNKDALYCIRKGIAWFMIGDDGKTLEAGYFICVPADKRHCILNNQSGSDVLVELTFPGAIKVD